VQRLRTFTTHALLAAYAVGQSVWDYVRAELQGSMVPLPRPRDEHHRFVAQWLCFTATLAAIWPTQNGAPPPLLKLLSEAVIRSANFHCDARHARLIITSSTEHTLFHLRGIFGFCLVVRLAIPLARRWLPEALRRLLPLLLQGLQEVETAADLASMVCQLRLEMCGIRGLLLLLDWHRWQPLRLLRLEPFEFEVQLPFKLYTQRLVNVYHRIGSSNHMVTYRWADVLTDYSVGLRALLVFYGERKFYAWRFPQWAVADIAALPTPGFWHRR